MLYNVAQLLKDRIGATRRREIQGDLLDLDENNPGHTPVTGQVMLLRTASGVLASGQCTFRARQACRRCLEVAEYEFSFAFEEEFQPTIDIETGVKLVLDDTASPELLIDERHILDLTEIVRQYAVVELLEGRLCRPDCKGLCPECGANLNLESCNGHSTSFDPRLAALRTLLAQNDDE